jgi:hypothetical protein
MSALSLIKLLFWVALGVGTGVLMDRFVLTGKDAAIDLILACLAVALLAEIGIYGASRRRP